VFQIICSLIEFDETNEPLFPLCFSLISTPPPERIPIKTHLSSFRKEKVIEAIKNELDRGGQVFYVLPRIKGLEEVMDFLEEAFPDIDIAMAHGKQYSKQLEETMERFAQGKIKILICTNIVESGLDIQNANTIIIQDVQQFGLAQLYQVPKLLVYFTFASLLL
jgi:transcription-repair coupling factor (superfamily II helicase)